jgi:hypothetical protein
MLIRFEAVETPAYPILPRRAAPKPVEMLRDNGRAK